VHVDARFDFPKVLFGYYVNINLVDTGPESDATEVWVGTHLGTDGQVLDAAGKVRLEILEEGRKVSPPIRPRLPKRFARHQRLPTVACRNVK
jgi:hypothetical protein